MSPIATAQKQQGANGIVQVMQLIGMFDGRTQYLPPGETHGIPRAAVELIKNQNPLMGSEDAYDPSSYTSLIGIKGEDDCTPLTISEDPQRVDIKPQMARMKGSKRKVEVISTRGASIFDAKAGVGADASFGKA